MKKSNRLLSGILAAVMSLMTTAGTFAPWVSAEPTAAAENGGRDYTVEGSNSFGNIVMDEFDINRQADSAELKKSDAASITRVAVSGKTAYVDYSSNFDCTLLVGIYDESGAVMYGSGNTELKEGSYVASVDINIAEMPQYFLVKAYIVDSFSNIPVALVYETNEYSQVVQEFLSKTAADFDADKVVVLDETTASLAETDNNFAVYNKNVVILPASGSSNVIVNADYDNNKFVVSNPSSECNALGTGNIAAIKYDDNWVIVKVSSIEASADHANSIVIQGSSDYDLADVFDYIKIDSSKAAAETAQQSLYIQGIDGYDDITDSKAGLSELSYDSTPIVLLKKEYKFEKSSSEERISEDKIALECEIEGKLKWTLNCGYKLRFDVLNPEVNSFDIALKSIIDAKITAKADYHPDEIEFPEIPEIPLAYGFNLNIEPKIDLEITIEGTAEYKSTSTVGIKGYFDQKSDNYKIEPYSKLYPPKDELNLSVEADIYIGIDLTVGISFIDDELFFIGISLAVGPELSAKIANKTNKDKVKHECVACLDGDIKLKIKLQANITVMGAEIKFPKSSAANDKNDKYKLGLGDDAEIKLGKEGIEAEVQLGDFYISDKNGMIAFSGTCPYCLFKVKVEVIDNGTKAPIKYANIYIDGETEASANSKSGGVAELWLSEGDHTVRARKTGRIDKTIEVSVDPDNAGSTSIVKSSSSNNESFSYAANGDNYSPILATVYLDGNSAVKEVSMGGSHGACITEDGSLYTWGNNAHGQLGSETYTYRYSTVPIKIADNVKTVSSGNGYYGAYITEDGSLYTWGDNSNGKLGNGTKEDSAVPIKIMDNVKAVSLGQKHSACITEGGSLYTWGYNDNGRLGNGTATSSTLPVKIMDNVKAVSLDDYHSACITEDGSLYTWGSNNYGKLGDGTTKGSKSPIKIMDNVKAVSLGYDHSACITEDGSLYTWGRNMYGELGNGTTEDSYDPIKIMDNVKAVSLSSHNSACITEDGSLYTWGDNSYRELGNGTKDDSYVPIKVMDNVESVSMGRGSAACITEDGSLYTWGSNSNGVLGNGTTTASYVPTKIDIIATDVSEEKNAASAGTEKTAQFTGLIPNGVYNFYSVKQDSVSGSLVNSGNLLYVTQTAADSSGSISLTFTPSTDISVTPVNFVKAMKKRSVESCTVSVPNLTENGEEQTAEPVVKYGSEILVKGRDYYLGGDYSAVNAGTYYLYIIGMGEYDGAVMAGYTVEAASPEGPVAAFVNRLYTIILDRPAEEAGLADWTNSLKSGERTSADIVYGLANSQEFNNKALSNDAIVERMYLAMLGRASDASGKADWLDAMAGGCTVNGIINGFSGSEEFAKICLGYGIEAGSVTECEARDRNTSLTAFVSRMYTKALGRAYDVDGLNDWTGDYLSGTKSADDIAYGFILSQEFVNRGLSDEAYVDTLYRTFFDREPDEGGKTSWLDELNNGASRQDVLDGFLGAPEFENLKKSFGV